MYKTTVKKTLMSYVSILLIMFAIVFFMYNLNKKTNNLTYNEFVLEASRGEVKKLSIVPRSRAGIYELHGVMKDYVANETFVVKVPLSDEVMTKILRLQEDHEFSLNTVADPDSSTL